MSCGFYVWVAYASRMLVSALRRNNLFFGFDPQEATKADQKSSRPRGRNRQHARRVLYQIKFAAR